MATSFPIPLNALRAIEIVARTGALAPAAEELGVTMGAVSQHIRRAEDRLGLKLFNRTPAGLRPTPELDAIQPQLRAGFQQLAGAMEALTQADNPVLTLTTGNVFASRWLVWRMSKFSALHPDIELRLAIEGHTVDLSRGDIDCGIRFGRGQWDGVKAFPLGGFRYQPVCAPPLAAQLKRPEDLTHLPVIIDESTMLSWASWWRAAGFKTPPETHGPRFSDPALAFDAAVSEQGVLLAVDMMSADMVSDGRLVKPFGITVDDEVGYYFVMAEGRRMTRKVQALRDWLASEVPASRDGYVAQLGEGGRRLVPAEQHEKPSR